MLLSLLIFWFAIGILNNRHIRKSEISIPVFVIKSSVVVKIANPNKPAFYMEFISNPVFLQEN